MTIPGHELLETLLRESASRKPVPVFPADVARSTGVSREAVEAAFDHLRTMKLVFLTDWIQGHGRGFIITEDGMQVLRDPVLLDRLRMQPVSPLPGVLSAPPRPAPAPRLAEAASEPSDDGALNEQPAPEDRPASVLQSLLSPPRPYVTYCLVLGILMVFLYGLFLALDRNVPLRTYIGLKPDLQVARIIHDSGALLPEDIVVNREWWRLLAHAFVQGWGLLGLLLGMWYLYSIGKPAEGMWGPMRLLGMFAASVVGGGAAALLWDSVAFGVFAADCGLMAGQLVWLTGNHAYLPREAAVLRRGILSNMLFIVIISALLFTVVPDYTPAIPIGGAAAGAVFAVFALWNRYHHGPLCVFGLLGMIAVPAVILTIVANSFDAIKENQQQRLARAIQNQLQQRNQAEKDRLEALKGTPHDQALKTARKAYDDFAVEILANQNRGKEFDDRERVSAAKIAFREACAELGKGIDFLEKKGPRGEKTTLGLKLDREFHSFYQNFIKALDSPRQFANNRNDLIRQGHRVVELLTQYEAAKR